MVENTREGKTQFHCVSQCGHNEQIYGREIIGQTCECLVGTLWESQWAITKSQFTFFSFSFTLTLNNSKQKYVCRICNHPYLKPVLFLYQYSHIKFHLIPIDPTSIDFTQVALQVLDTNYSKTPKHSALRLYNTWCSHPTDLPTAKLHVTSFGIWLVSDCWKHCNNAAQTYRMSCLHSESQGSWFRAFMMISLEQWYYVLWELSKTVKLHARQS